MEALKTLDARGYIAQTNDLSDARAVLISSTPKSINFLRVVCLGIMDHPRDSAARGDPQVAAKERIDHAARPG